MRRSELLKIEGAGVWQSVKMVKGLWRHLNSLFRWTGDMIPDGYTDACHERL